MKFLKYLQEEFAGSRQIYKFSKRGEVDVEFFSNPTPAEIKDAYKASEDAKCIRFLVDFDKKTVIIWEGSILHPIAMKSFNKKYNKLDDFFIGVAMPISGRMKIITKYDKYFLSKVTENKKWLDKYFTNINKIKWG